MKNNKGFNLVWILVIIAVLAIIFGAYYLGKGSNKISPITENNNYQPQENQDSKIADLNQNQNNNLIEDNKSIRDGWKTYANAQYGFSFNYPSSWKLVENKIEKSVTIDTNDVSGVNQENRDNPGYPSWSIKFKVTDKTFFTQQRIATKIGIITYDENLKALMSEGCLKASQLFGNFNGNGTSIQAITYGGSLMSDPAYSDSAILTNSEEIIIVHSEQGVATTPKLLSQLSEISSSFKLLNGNTVFIPDCAK